MSALHTLPAPKSYADAERSFLVSMGDPRRLCKYLTVALAVTAAAIVALSMATYRLATQQRERIVVRIDDIGRAQAVGFTGTSTIKEPEVKYFLANFVQQYYGRNRVTIQKDYERSMMFLDGHMAAARAAHERETNDVAKFAVGGDDEVEVIVKKIILRDLSHEPYAAQVDMDKVFTDRSGNVTRRDTSTVSLTWEVAKEVSNAAIPVNPLGFTITSIREDQAFK